MLGFGFVLDFLRDRGLRKRAPSGRSRTVRRQPFTVETVVSSCVSSFTSPINLPVRRSAEAVAVGDFTGGGRADIVSVNGAQVSVLPNNGDGTFQSAVNTAIAPGYHTLAAADLTGNGKLDVVVATRGFTLAGPNFVSVLRGNGDGTFQAPVDFQLSTMPQSVTLADLDGDGKPDLLVEAFTADGTFETQVFLNKGDGTFSAGMTLPILRPVVADFTGDGRLDVAGISGMSSVSAFLGNGDGTFQPPLDSPVGGEGPVLLAAADFNGDCRPDLAVTTFTSSEQLFTHRVRTLLGNGDGTFHEAPVSTPLFRYGAQPTLVAVADLSGRGILDLVEGDSQFGDVTVLRGLGDGSFQTADTFHGVLGSDALNSGAVADFNGDGLPDFAVPGSTGATSGSVAVFLNARPKFPEPLFPTCPRARVG